MGKEHKIDTKGNGAGNHDDENEEIPNKMKQKKNIGKKKNNGTSPNHCCCVFVLVVGFLFCFCPITLAVSLFTPFLNVLLSCFYLFLGCCFSNCCFCCSFCLLVLLLLFFCWFFLAVFCLFSVPLVFFLFFGRGSASFCQKQDVVRIVAFHGR